MTTIYSFSAEKNNEEVLNFSEFQGKTLLIVNVASRCGYTPQYEGLEKLYQKFKDQNFLVLGFPCNQFGQQEPGSDKEIQEFCSLKFNVTFPLFKKINVNGKDAHPLYVYLKGQAKGFLGTETIKWNFTKFLVDKNGNVVDRFASKETPENLEKIIQKIL